MAVGFRFSTDSLYQLAEAIFLLCAIESALVIAQSWIIDLPQGLGGAVLRTVVDHDDLDVLDGLCEHRLDAGQGLRLAVTGRYDDRHRQGVILSV